MTPRQSSDDSIDLQELLVQMSSEASTLLASAIDRVNTLAHSGRIDRAGLRSLRDELERARRAGMLGQQICRIASARVRVHDERIDLKALFADLMLQRQRDVEARRLVVESKLQPATVVGDITLVFAMIGALLDWGFDVANGTLGLVIDLRGQPRQATVEVSLPCRSDGGDAITARPMSWRLVQVCAHKLELHLDRREHGARLVVEIRFPKTVIGNEAQETVLDAGMDDPPSSHSSRPLAGVHLLVVCARRELRVEVREAAQGMGVMLDFVSSVDEARDFCVAALPDAIVFEAPQGGAPMVRLIGELRARSPALAFVEIIESGRPVASRQLGPHPLCCVARPALRDALPMALDFELGRAT